MLREGFRVQFGVFRVCRVSLLNPYENPKAFGSRFLSQKIKQKNNQKPKYEK